MCSGTLWLATITALLVVGSQAAKHSFKAEFVYRDEDLMGHGFGNGTVHFRYDTDDHSKNVIRYDFVVPTTISIFWVEKDQRIYKKCGSSCEGSETEMKVPELFLGDLGKCSSYGSDGLECSGVAPLKTIWFESRTSVWPSKYLMNNSKEYTLANVASEEFNSLVFNVDEAWNCGRCVSMLDLFFLLDSSESIGKDNWALQIDFLNQVMNLFTLGEKATAISIITWDSYFSILWPLTTSYHSTPSTSNMPYLPGPGTEQYLGFMEMERQLTEKSFILPLGRSRRLHSSVVPTTVAIVVTDGDDQKKELAIEWSKKIKKDFNAYVMEITVGFVPDMKFLSQVASTINLVPAVFNVSNYKELKKLTDVIVQTSCSYESKEEACSPDCKAFCGCNATCFCPECDDTKTKCQTNKCSTDGTTATKCVKKNVDCLANTNKCIEKTCDPVTAVCSSANVTCVPPMTPSEKECHCAKMVCNSVSGCVNNPMPSLCPSIFCKQAVACDCSQDGNFPDIAPGCIYSEYTCPPSSVTCMEPSCDSLTGVCSYASNCGDSGDRCVQILCNQESGKCETKNKLDGHLKQNCFNAECNAATGVITDVPFDCAKMNDEKNPCIKWTCNPLTNKCEDETIPDCFDCGEIECEPKACFIPSCAEDDKGNFVCKQTNVECNRGMCETGTCNSGSSDVNEACIYVSDCRPGNACFDPVCNGPHNCTLEPRVDACSGDKCHINGRCTDNVTGACVFESPCKKTKCQNETCMDGMCTYKEFSGCPVSENLVKCYSPRCDPDTDSCVLDAIVCDDDDPCTIDTCDNAIGCVFSYPQPDVCEKLICDPNATTDEERWVFTDKCDDGLYCTTNKCNFQTGECSSSQRTCEEELSMDGYPCFYRECSPTRLCYRKLLRNAFIDVCGNCVVDDEKIQFSGSNVPVDEECLDGMGTDIITVGLTAGAIAAIVIVAIILLAALSASSAYGAKTLVDRAKKANDQGAQMNPLFEADGNDFDNPSFMGN